ncbi:hypothetical protein GF327_02725 [Candidatus Woesearchaeota archaeon]|nr:hypothetical protein [Candidatus Woesearchaeota archaeon]
MVETKETGTCIISIAELSHKFAGTNKNFTPFFKFLNSKSKIIHLSFSACVKSGRLKQKIRKNQSGFGIADALIYLSSKENNSKLVTKDYDFKGLDDVVLLQTESN